MLQKRVMAVAVGVLALALSACAAPVESGPPASDTERPSAESTLTPAVTPLGDVEVREYQGEPLDPVSGFRENSIKGPQQVDEATYRLRVNGLVGTPESYTYSEITSGFPAYEKVVQLNCVEGWSERVLWQGVLVRDILDASEVMPEARSIIFHAADGYTTSEPLEYVYDNDILLAYSQNGMRLAPERGFPFQLLAEDKWGYKWCKWVVRIELSAEEDPGGFWEDRGYSNSGDLDRPYFAN